MNESGKSIGIEDVVLHEEYRTTETQAYNDLAVVTLKPNTGKHLLLKP